MQVKKKKRNINGVLLLDKPKGMSSNQILQKIKWLYSAQKAGHTGALDPIATGMLPICFGDATKFSNFLLDADKSYRVTALLGVRTNTSDIEGEVIATKPVKVTEQDILEHLPQFTGTIQQVPTMFSALKYQGRPLYEYARKGIEVPRVARPIKIYQLDLINYAAPFLTLDVSCSKGTYIRTLVDDLGEALGCGAHVVELRRTAVAKYKYEQMYSVETLTNLTDLAELDSYLLPVDSAVTQLPKLELTNQQASKILLGQQIVVESDINGLVRLSKQENNQFLGIAEISDNVVQPKRLIAANS